MKILKYGCARGGELDPSDPSRSPGVARHKFLILWLCMTFRKFTRETRGELTIERLFYGGLAFSLIAFCGVQYYADMAADYSITTASIDPDLYRYSDVYDDTHAAAAEGTDSLKSKIREIPGFGSLFSFLEVIGSFLNSMLSSFEIGALLVTNLELSIGPYVILDEYVINILLTAMGAAVMFALAAVIANRRP